MIVVKNSIPHHRIDNPIHCGAGVEVIAVQLKLPTQEISVYNIYRKEDQTLDLGELLPHAANHLCIVAGDFNAHHHLLCSLSNTNDAGNHIAQLLEDLPTVKLLNNGEPTHDRGGRLDLTFTSEVLAHGANWTTHSTLTSDHFAIQIEIQTTLLTIPLPPPKWNLRKANWGLFQAKMNDWWREYNPPMDLDEREEDFTAAITQAADVAIPKTTPARSNRKDWWFFSPEVQQINRRLSAARKLHRRNPCPETVSILRSVAHHKREITREQRTKRWYEWCASFNKHTTLGKLWEKVKIATGRPPPRLPAHHDPQGEAERLADHFQERGSTATLPKSVQDRLLALLPGRMQAFQAACNMTAPSDQPFTSQELLQARKGRRDTASGSDGITYSMLQCAGPSADEAFLSLMNQSWEEGRMPRRWKYGDIVVVQKPGSTNNTPKLRPLTLLKCPGKTAEAMVLPRLQWQIGPLHPYVFGFVRGSSTADCIMTFLALVDNSQSIAVFLDLEKAFELACPAAILDALVKKGVRGRMLSWIGDYLHSRQSRVRYQGTTSTYREYHNGAPQGGILSPTGLNLLVEQLVALLLPKGAHLLSYADDLVLVVTKVPNKHMVAQRSLKLISDKCADLGLKMSAQKSKAMHLFPRKGEQLRRLTVQNTHLEWVTQQMYLGVIIDQRLSFRAEVDYLRNRTGSRLNVMRAMTNPAAGATPSVLRLFYIHAIRPLIDYAAPALSYVAKTWMDQLEVAQNNALRTILGAPIWTNIGTMQAETNIIPLELRIQQLTAGRVAKILQHNRSHTVRNCLGGFYDIAYNRVKKWGPRTAAAFSLMVDNGPHLQTIINPDLTDHRYTTPPPWETLAISFTTTTLPGTRAECSGPEMRQLALQNITELQTPGTTCYYTDGSVDPTSGATGSAFVVSNVVTAWRNNDHLSSLQTELVAIDGALSHAEGGPGTSIAILTDSMAAIQILQRRHHHDNIALITSILGRAQTLINQGTHIRIHWVPSHVGLRGNETADSAARWATQQQHITRTVRPSLTQIKERAKAKAKALAHIDHERMAASSRSMRWYMDVTAYIPLMPHPQLTRKTAVAAQRLRLGYRTFAERSPGSGTLTCQHCGTWNEKPLIHYLCSCPATIELRTPPLEGDTDGRTAAVAIVKRACEDLDRLLPLLDRALPPR